MLFHEIQFYWMLFNATVLWCTLACQDLSLLSMKPVIYAANVPEALVEPWLWQLFRLADLADLARMSWQRAMIMSRLHFSVLSLPRKATIFMVVWRCMGCKFFVAGRPGLRQGDG